MQRLVLVLLVFVLSVNAQSAEDPWLQIERASQAARQLSYKGIFVYQNNHDNRSIEITHLNNGSEEFARIVTLDGACLLYTSPSPRDRTRSRMPSSA